MLKAVIGGLHFAANVKGSDGSIQGNPFNIASGARSAKGVYVVTLDEGIATADVNIQATSQSDTAVASAAWTSATTVTVKTWDYAGAAIDADVYVKGDRTNIG